MEYHGITITVHRNGEIIGEKNIDPRMQLEDGFLSFHTNTEASDNSLVINASIIVKRRLH